VRRTMRVLVVEDEKKVAKALREGLQAEHYDVRVAASGEEGFFLVNHEAFDCVVLDLMLPQRDGLEVLTTLRKRGLHTPVLILTAKDTVDDRVRGLDSGADDYLVKPFAFPELLARLRALARRGDAERPVVLEVDDLRLDPATREVTRAGTQIELSPKEFALLETFMRRPGEVLSRLHMLEHAWDFAYDNRSNVVDVYVRRLRRKIDEPFGRDSLETVRGVGYRLRPDAAA
jgi:two-component system, OmpR family, response regulator